MALGNDNELHSNLQAWPLILAGPILRRTERDAVTVWLALKESRLVTLRVYATQQGKGLTPTQLLLEGTRHTIQLGKYLHVVAVTAQLIQPQPLETGQIYAYDLLLNRDNLNTALNTDRIQVSVSYFSHQLPTFSLSPHNLNYLKIVHGSCRKPHGGEFDALPFLDYLIQESAHLPDSRPHQLFLTGDQIYGDDVADPVLWSAGTIASTLFGWEENLPLSNGWKKASQLLPGERSEIAKIEGGFTAMLHNKAQKAKSHLFSFGEYAVVYLFAWSSLLLPERFVKGKTIHANPKLAKQWDKEVAQMASFARDLWRVRRALANVPTYTIFDDHDISDDWYLNREWCDRVLSRPLGRRVVQNGLLAYAIFQAWGNTPEQFFRGKSGEKLLLAAQKWLASQGTDKSAWQEIGLYLGIPSSEPKTGLPKLKQDGNVLVLARDDRALQWHYTIRSCKHEVIVLDTRTWRGYPEGEKQKTAPPMLLSPTAFVRQIQQPLAQTDALNKTAPDKIEATMVVLPTNLVALSLVDFVQRWDLQRDRTFSNDVGDSWNFNQQAFTQLLVDLSQRRDRIIILSGDIHYSCAVRLSFWSRDRDKTSILVQLTSSALKNSEWSTRLIHTKVKSLLPELTQDWAGWQKPPQLIEVVITPEGVRRFEVPVADCDRIWYKIRSWQGNENLAWQIAVRDRESLPNWQYRLEWIQRQKSRPLFWQKPQSSVGQKVPNPLVSWLWCNQWLQEGQEVIGRNNLSVVSLKWSQDEKAAIQETYWHPPWHPSSVVKSCYFVPF